MKSISLLNDIRFWIVLFFIARLFSINQTCVDSYAWRQADGYSIARNFLEEDAHILYPRVDNREDKSGITGSEFPLLNYLTYQIYRFTDVQWFPGRLINLLVSCFGVFFFYKLLEEYIFKEMAFYASMILMVSIWFSFSRKFTPDTFSCSLVISGVYFTYSYFKEKRIWRYILAIVLIGFGLLCKLPAFVLLAFLIPVGLTSLKNTTSLLQFLALGSLFSIPALLWYFYWVPHLNETYGISYFFMGQSFSDSISGLWHEKSIVFKRFYQSSFFYVAFIHAAAGTVFLIKNKENKLSGLFWSGLILGGAFILKSGTNFTEHTYYVIPLIPLMSVLAAYGIFKLYRKKHVQILVLLLICAECIGNQISVWKTNHKLSHYSDLESLASENTSPTDLILVNGALSPAPLYMSHRKGKSLLSIDFSNAHLMNHHLSYANYIFWDKKDQIPDYLNEYPLIKETQHWKILKLN